MLAEPDEHICLNARCHGVVLARPLARALPLVLAGGFVLTLPWAAAAPVGALLVAAGALLTLRAVWAWERTRLVVTTDKVFVVNGTLRRTAKAVRLRSVDAVEVDQSLAGQLLGYGTVIVGQLEIPHVAEPADVYRLLEHLAGEAESGNQARRLPLPAT